MNYKKPKRSCMNLSGTQFFPLIFNGNENNSLGCYKITEILSQKPKRACFQLETGYTISAILVMNCVTLAVYKLISWPVRSIWRR